MEGREFQASITYADGNLYVHKWNGDFALAERPLGAIAKGPIHTAKPAQEETGTV
jgi:hypothetical protein